jgi:hypothetical protein
MVTGSLPNTTPEKVFNKAVPQQKQQKNDDKQHNKQQTTTTLTTTTQVEGLKETTNAGTARSVVALVVSFKNGPFRLIYNQERLPSSSFCFIFVLFLKCQYQSD